MFNKGRLFSTNKTVMGTAMASLGWLSYNHEQQKRNTTKLAQAQSNRVQAPFFHAAVHSNPKYEKRFKEGEDSYIVSSPSQKLIGVADGVGGWGEVDICSGKCSKYLTRKIGELFEVDRSRDLKGLLFESVKALTAEEVEGSTTMVLAKLEEDEEEAGGNSTKSGQAQMHTLNLGDSAYMLLRPEPANG